jgi:hypothetical protein
LKKDSPYAFVAGIILTLVLWLIVVEIIWPASVPLYFIPISIFVIILWLNAWRVTRKKQQASTG